MYNTMPLPTLLCGRVTLAIREKDKCRITSGTINFMNKMTKYRRKDHETIKNILLELNINPVEKKSKITAVSEYNIIGQWTQTTTLNYEISTMWET